MDLDPIEFPLGDDEKMPVDDIWFCGECGWIAFIRDCPREHYEPGIPPMWPCKGKPKRGSLVADESLIGRIKTERDRQLTQYTRNNDGTKSIAEWRDLILKKLNMAEKGHRKKHLIQAAALVLAALEATQDHGQYVFELEDKWMVQNYRVVPPSVFNALSNQAKNMSISYRNVSERLEQLEASIKLDMLDELDEKMTFAEAFHLKQEALREQQREDWIREARQGGTPPVRRGRIAELLHGAEQHGGGADQGTPPERPEGIPRRHRRLRP